MIEILEGTHEIINFKSTLGIRLFNNGEYEDYPEHWHTAIEIIMPLKHGYQVVIAGNKFSLNEGDIFIINSGVLHSLKAPNIGERIILQFSDYILYSVKGMETLLTLLPEYIFISENNDVDRIYSFIKKHMDAIAVEYDQKKSFFEASIYANIIEIFAYLGRNAIWGRTITKRPVYSNPSKKKEYMETIMIACNYINENFTHAISLDDAASITGFSKFHFSRIFKQCMNMTFYEYLNNRRVSKAEELLAKSEYTVLDIALSSGFSSLSAFNRTFRSLKNCSPSEYRKKEDIRKF
jgi:hypothetical protein